MSITDELRHSIEEAEQVYGCECKHLLALADRIDAEHERAMADAYLSGTPTDEKLTELGWIRLPKDADGEYIHIGDVMEWVPYDDTWPTVVRKVVAVGTNVFFAWSDEKQEYAQYEACAYHHHYIPTVEDVLREFALAIFTDDEWPIRKDIVDEYAAKLRLAEERETYE